jgi:Spy/CpxP family protein refolding chaperone
MAVQSENRETKTLNNQPVFSMSNDDNLKKWREGGRSQRINIVLFALAVVAMVLLAIRIASSAPSPQTDEHPSGHAGPRSQGAERRLAWLSEKLKLTDEQKSKIKPMLEDEHKQLMALREDSALSRQEKRAKFEEIHASTFDRMRPILTDQQQATLKQIQEQRQQRMKARRERGSESLGPRNE